MKKRHIIELILLGTAIIAFIMKLLHIAGSNILIVVSLMSLAMIYFIGGYFIFNDVKLSFKKSEHPLSTKRVTFSIAFGWALSTLIVGMLFRLMIWQGSDVQISSGLVLTMLPMLFLLLYIQFKKLDVGSVKQILLRGSLGIIIGLVLFNINEKSVVNLYYHDMPEYRDAMIRLIENPNDPEAQKEWRDLNKKDYVEPNQED